MINFTAKAKKQDTSIVLPVKKAEKGEVVVSREDFEALIRSQYDRIFAFAYRSLGSKAEAEDLTQDVVLSLPGKISGWRGECALETWLFRIVRNAAIDRIRARRRETDAIPHWAEAERALREEEREKRERLAWLKAQIEALPDDLRVTAALLVDEGITQAEAAAILEVQPGTVAWRMSEIKDRLRKAAESEGVDG